MSTHRYHRRDLNADLLRAGLGSAACIAPLFFLEPGAIASYVLAVPAAFFILFGLRTWAHGRTRVTLDDSGVVLDRVSSFMARFGNPEAFLFFDPPRS